MQQNNDFIVRCSALGNIMAKSSGLTKIEAKKLDNLIAKGSNSKERYKLEAKRDFKPDFDLSKGAMTYVENRVKNKLLDIDVEFDTPQTLKGTEEEDESISLFNSVMFKSYKKNIVRITNKWITGECDIDDDKESLIIDIKSSFTKVTFPLMPKDCKNNLYEWQLRGYMMLYNRDNAALAYCLVNTPDHLIPPDDDFNLHNVDDIDPFLRVTTLSFTRDLEKEELIKYKVEECRKYYNHYMDLVLNKNQ